MAINDNDGSLTHFVVVNNVTHYGASCFLDQRTWASHKKKYPPSCYVYIDMMQSDDIKDSIAFLKNAGYTDSVEEFEAYKITLKAIFGAGTIDRAWCYPACDK